MKVKKFPGDRMGYMGLYWDKGKENRNCYLGFRVRT